MRYALISDIHSNLEALQAALAAITAAKPDGILCLGDMVGYGADPNGCIELAREYGIVAIAGNHDRAALTLDGIAGFNMHAQRAARWTHEVLTAENRAWLTALPDSAVVDDLVLVHGALTDRDDYIFTKRDIEANLLALEQRHPQSRVCFFGHTHIRVLHTKNGAVRKLEAGDEFLIPANSQTLLNPGSLGQPRDGNPRAAFGIIDTATFGWRQLLVEYDVAAARRKIIDAGLPAFLGERLLTGK